MRPFGSILRKHLQCGRRVRYTGGRCNTDAGPALAAKDLAVGVLVCMLRVKGPPDDLAGAIGSSTVRVCRVSDDSGQESRGF